MASAAGRGADARLGLDAGQGPNAVIKEGGQGKEGLEKKPEKIYSMQIGHSQPVDNPRHQSFLLFKKLLEEKTDGGIQVDIYPAGQLGSEASMLEQVCDGTIQGFRGGQLEIVTEVNYQFHPEPFYVNTRWYESLPPEYQEILAECTEEMMKENNRLIDENEVQAMENIRANAEIYTLSREERQAFVEATQVVYDEYMDNGLLTMDDLARMKRIIRGEEK